jgi:CheY-like chemotaxis protein
MPPRDARRSDGRRPHVLVIDDTPELLDLFVELRESEPYRVTTSRTILTVDDIRVIAPDAIVHDLFLAGDHDDGIWQVVSQMRSNPRLAQVPLILCTADPRIVRDRDVVGRRERLAVPVVRKPFTLEEMLNAIAHVLERPEPGANTVINASYPPLSEGVRPVVDWCAS